MIVSHSRKFVYFAPPKTASTTTHFMLWIGGLVDDSDLTSPIPLAGVDGNIVSEHRHMTPTEAVAAGYVTADQLHEYVCYAGLRHPEARYVSAYSHAQRFNQIPEVLVKRHNDLGLLSRPQEDWFTFNGSVICQPLHFDNLDAQLGEIIPQHGGTPPARFVRLNQSGNPTGTIEDLFTSADALATVRVALTVEQTFYNTMLSRR